ncbi:hypothetical protein VST7929_02101 [Vibrio stylophorae]|uniref:Acyl-CoA dehydrogenase/oxidase N-terminal domain-containing protein n=1 Tax=Vibrio stylophorae TaxID=659351 RepID=A0ABM8ZV46_9VIBR|nr:acyl-CoA dehydrogenase family protein [Vibrio stylophorae]CAH0534193.1 hypothetical protein VST7929_02101 [Vibrio stylophorae]
MWSLLYAFGVLIFSGYLIYLRSGLWLFSSSTLGLLILGVAFSLLTPWAVVLALLILTPLNLLQLRQKALSLTLYPYIAKHLKKHFHSALQGYDYLKSGWDSSLFQGRADQATLNHLSLPRSGSEGHNFLAGPVAQLGQIYSPTQPERWQTFLQTQGFYRLCIDKRYQGFEFTPFTLSRVIQRCSTIAPQLGALIASPARLHAEQLIKQWANHKQKDEWLSAIASEELKVIVPPSQLALAHGDEKITPLTGELNEHEITVFGHCNQFEDHFSHCIVLCQIQAQKDACLIMLTQQQLHQLNQQHRIGVDYSQLLGCHAKAKRIKNQLRKSALVPYAIAAPSLTLAGFEQLTVLLSAQLTWQNWQCTQAPEQLEPLLVQSQQLTTQLRALIQFHCALHEHRELGQLSIALSHQYGLHRLQQLILQLQQMQFRDGPMQQAHGMLKQWLELCQQQLQRSPFSIAWVEHNAAIQLLYSSHPYFHHSDEAIRRFQHNSHHRQRALKQFDRALFGTLGLQLSHMLAARWWGLSARFRKQPQQAKMHQASCNFALYLDALLTGQQPWSTRQKTRLFEYAQCLYIAAATVQQCHHPHRYSEAALTPLWRQLNRLDQALVRNQSKRWRILCWLMSQAIRSPIVPDVQQADQLQTQLKNTQWQHSFTPQLSETQPLLWHSAQIWQGLQKFKPYRTEFAKQSCVLLDYFASPPATLSASQRELWLNLHSSLAAFVPVHKEKHSDTQAVA